MNSKILNFYKISELKIKNVIGGNDQDKLF